MSQLEMSGHAAPAVLRDPEQARLVRRLPAPLPVRLRRPADPAEGAALGAQHRRLPPCTPRCGRGGSWPVEKPHDRRGPAAALRRLVVRTVSATTSSRGRWRARAAGWLTDYVADARSRPTSRSAPSARSAPPPSGWRCRGRDRPHRPARRRTGDRRLQDRPQRRAPTTRPAAHRPSRPTSSGSGAPCAVPARRVELHHLPSGTVACLRAHRPLAGQPRPPGRGHRRSTSPRPPRPLPPVRTRTSPSRPRPACSAAGATSGPAVRPGRPPRPRATRGASWPRTTSGRLRRRGSSRRHPLVAAPHDRRPPGPLGEPQHRLPERRHPAVAAASVSPRPGSEYIRRAHCGSRATASDASPPHAGCAGVR